MASDAWPEALQQAVHDAVGDVLREERLSGLSGRAVTLVEGESGAVVVKEGAHPRELSFYREVAPALVDVPVPHVHARGDSWLVLEHVTEPLERDRWASADVYDVLANLHSQADAFTRLSDPFRPRWTSAITEAASRRIGIDLASYQGEAVALLEGPTPISGDPNPRNWRQRADASLVLLDWERAGFGSAAVDVAITLPGLPTQAEAGDAASRYGKASGVRCDERALFLCKLWTAVELLGDEREHEERREVTRWLTEALPSWLATWA